MRPRIMIARIEGNVKAVRPPGGPSGSVAAPRAVAYIPPCEDAPHDREIGRNPAHANRLRGLRGVRLKTLRDLTVMRRWLRWTGLTLAALAGLAAVLMAGGYLWMRGRDFAACSRSWDSELVMSRFHSSKVSSHIFLDTPTGCWALRIQPGGLG